VAARRARGSAHRRFGDARFRHAENGYLRTAAVLPAHVPQRRAQMRRLDHHAGDYRYHLRRAGGHGAAEHEEAGGVFVGEPPRVRRAGIVFVHAGRPGRRGVSDAQSWYFHRGVVHTGRLPERAAAFAGDFGLRRRGHSRAGSGNSLHDHHAGQHRAAHAEQLRGRVSGAAGRGAGEFQVGDFRGYRGDSLRVLHAVALPACVFRPRVR